MLEDLIERVREVDMDDVRKQIAEHEAHDHDAEDHSEHEHAH
jgi:hypothetical protein